MGFLGLDSIALAPAIILFVIAASLVWLAGSKLSKWADDFAEQTGVGRAFIGVLILGGITSLPELATTITASLEGNAGMAVSNILGGISMQVTILAFVDFWMRKDNMSKLASNTSIVIQGILLMIILGLSAIYIFIPSYPVFHIGLDSFSIFLIFISGLWLIHKYGSYNFLNYNFRDSRQIKIKRQDLNDNIKDLERNNKSTKQNETKNKVPVSGFLKQKGTVLLLLSLLILGAGYVIVKTAEVIAEDTGIGKNYAGLVLVAITTSLPEISTTIGSIKLKRYNMAISNIFGTNLFDISIIFIADFFFFTGPVFNALDIFTVVAAMLGLILTGIFLMGIIISSRRKIIGIGYDSLIVILVYLLGIIALYFMQEGS